MSNVSAESEASNSFVKVLFHPTFFTSDRDTLYEFLLKVFGAKETTHVKINADLGRSDDPATAALFAFVEKAVK